MSTRSSFRWAAAVLVAGSLLSVTACSGSDSDGGDASAPTTGVGSTVPASTTAPAVVRPEGPAADLSEAIEGGGAAAVGSARPVDLEAAGWTQSEVVAAGTATTYTAEGDLDPDGFWTLAEGETADFRTRVLVRRPADPADFNGTVVVEWLNVSGGVDADPDFAYLSSELLRSGTAWVGVSAQRIGVEGGDVLVGIGALADMVGAGLKGIDPARYGSLEHPGDGFAYDIFTQVGRAVRAGAGPLEGLEPTQVLAIGESQSGFALTTYANGVQPLTKAFDGFLLHSRGGPGLPLSAPGEAADLAGSIAGTPTKIRTDLDVPVLMIESESDLGAPLGFAAARQPDTDRIRTWEMAGTAHVDRFMLAALEPSMGCGPINDGPMHFIAVAALRWLTTWAAGGEAPPAAEPIGFADGQVLRDEDGIAEGGIRTAVVDVPVEVVSGAKGPSPEIVCLLAGSTTDLPAPSPAERYGSAEAYLEQFEEATDAAIEAGFLLEDDRAEILATAKPDLVTP